MDLRVHTRRRGSSVISFPCRQAHEKGGAVRLGIFSAAMEPWCKPMRPLTGGFTIRMEIRFMWLNILTVKRNLRWERFR